MEFIQLESSRSSTKGNGEGNGGRNASSSRIRLCASRLRGGSIARKKVEADAENVGDLLFPDSHLKIDQSIRFEGVAEDYQFADQIGDGFG